MHGFTSDRKNMIAILEAVQEAEGVLSPERIDEVSRYLGVSSNETYSVASFYPGLSFSPAADSTTPDPALGPEASTSRAAVRVRQKILFRDRNGDGPEGIDAYTSFGGYGGLVHALAAGRTGALDELEASGLRVRVGYGEPAAARWRQFCDVADGEKYVVCGTGEACSSLSLGDVLWELRPHSVLEGMIITAYVCGASLGYAVVDSCNQEAMERIASAVQEARERGFLGSGILGDSRFSFDVEIIGAPRGVVPEETALLRFIEGGRAEPRPQPPSPAISGLWGKPTLVSDPETLANVTAVMDRGADWFVSHGTETSRGTKLLILAGDVERPGLVEVPLGTTMRDIVWGDVWGGGISEGRGFKTARLGGPAGGYWPTDALDTPLDYQHIEDFGLAFGSGELWVVDDRACIVDELTKSLEVVQSESCGQCVVGRETTFQMLEILDQVRHGVGRAEDIDLLKELAESMETGSLCQYGRRAAGAVLSVLRSFTEELNAHIKQKGCPVGVCPGPGAR